MQTWKEKHPDYQFYEWNNETIQSFPFKTQKQISQMWGRERYNGVSDLIRYEILHRYGGFVAPADSECLQPIDDLLGLGCFACYENEAVRGDLVSPHLGTCPGNKLLEAMIEELSKKENVIVNDPWIETGNQFLTDMIKKLNYSDIKILPSYTFIPEHYTGERYKGEGKVYAKHFWGSTLNLYNNL
jgi:mannosyltransferase OCH1-like enzyme